MTTTENNYIDSLRPPRLSSTFGDERSSVTHLASTGRLSVGTSYQSLGALEEGDTGAAVWKCVSYGVIPSVVDRTQNLGYVVVSWIDGNFWVPDGSGNGYEMENMAFEKSPDMFGADTTGATPCEDSVYQAYRSAGHRGIVRFNAKKTYLFSGRIIPTSEGWSFTTYWDGATLKLAEGAGVEMMIFGSGAIWNSPDDYNDNSLIFKGDVFLDAQGQLQQFKNAQLLREGTGTIATQYNNPTGLAYQAASAQVFAGKIWPLANNDAANRDALITGVRYDYMEVDGGTMINRVEDGIVAFGCRLAKFHNIRDRDGLNTNDQQVIAFHLGGVDTGGHQHFAVKGNQATSWGVVTLDVTGAISVGDELVGATSNASATVYRIDGNDYYVDSVKRNSFKTGEDVEVNSVVQATVEYFSPRPRGLTRVIDCDFIGGNTGAGYVGISQDNPYAGLEVRGGSAENCGTAGYRMEGGGYAIIKPNYIRNVGINCDMTKTLLYPSMQAVNISNTARHVDIDIPLIENMRVDLEESIDIERAVVKSHFVCSDSDPLASAITGSESEPTETNFVNGNCLVSGVMTGCLNQAGGYVIQNGVLGTAAEINQLEFDTVKNVLNSTRNAKNIRGRNCFRVVNSPFTSSNVNLTYSNIEVYNVDDDAIVLRGFAGSLSALIDNLSLTNVGGNAVFSGDTNVDRLKVQNSDFVNIGTDTTRSDENRAVISCNVDEIILSGNSIYRDDTNAFNLYWYLGSQTDNLDESGTSERDLVGNGWERTEVSNGDFAISRPKAVVVEQISSNSVTVTRPVKSVRLLVGSGATDTLETFTWSGAEIGDRVTFCTANPNTQITINDNDSFELEGETNFTLNSRYDVLFCEYTVNSKWREISRSNNDPIGT